MHTVSVTPLISALPEGAVITDPDRMASYRWDRANDPSAGTRALPPCSGHGICDYAASGSVVVSWLRS